MASFLRFLDHSQRRITVGRTPLDEWSAHRRDLYLTTHSTHNRRTSMPPVGFEPTISEGKRPQTYALDRAATGTGNILLPAGRNFRVLVCSRHGQPVARGQQVLCCSRRLRKQEHVFNLLPVNVEIADRSDFENEWPLYLWIYALLICFYEKVLKLVTP